jgi:nitrite reductase/ring-hydroxylating ferredoxin subunit
MDIRNWIIIQWLWSLSIKSTCAFSPVTLMIMRPRPRPRSVTVWKNDGCGKHHSTAVSRQPSTSRIYNNFAANARSQEDDAPTLGAWIPVGSVSSLRGLTPVQVEIMGMNYVVWQNQNGQWSLLEDACPHRLVPLSQGRMNTDTNCLECAYHGWQFDTSGTVTHIPQLLETANKPLPSIQAPSLPVHTTGDLIWAFLPSKVHGESFPIIRAYLTI